LVAAVKELEAEIDALKGTSMTDLSPEEQIAKHYAACMDSVALINGGKPRTWMTPSGPTRLLETKSIFRLMLAKDFWTTEDLAPLQAASV